MVSFYQLIVWSKVIMEHIRNNPGDENHTKKTFSIEQRVVFTVITLKGNFK
jgi:hypothetical protein